MLSMIKKAINYIRYKNIKVVNEDIKITHNNIMLEMDPAIINWFINKATKELEERKKEFN